MCEKEKRKNEKEHLTLTLDVPVDDAVFMEHVDGCDGLFAVEPDYVLLQPQSGHFLQRALVTVLHEDVHLLLQVRALQLRPNSFSIHHVMLHRD